MRDRENPDLAFPNRVDDRAGELREESLSHAISDEGRCGRKVDDVLECSLDVVDEHAAKSGTLDVVLRS
jgi:hypothetical protein